MTKKEMIVLEKDYIDEIIRRDNNLQSLKSFLLKAPITHNFSREDFINMVRKIDELTFSISQMSERMKEIHDEEIENMMRSA